MFCFFCTATPPPEIYTLSLHDALPISKGGMGTVVPSVPMRKALLGLDVPQDVTPAVTCGPAHRRLFPKPTPRDRKSTRLNSSHRCISYAVFCLKKKKNNRTNNQTLKIT